MTSEPSVSPIAELLALVWSRELAVTNVWPDDDFFTLGGTPELAEGVLARVHELFGVGLSIVDLFTDPTLDAFAVRIEGAMVADLAPGAAEKFWQERLADLPELRLPADRPSAAGAAPQEASSVLACRRSWPPGLEPRLRALSPVLESAFTLTLLLAFAVLLSRFTGQSRIPLTVPSGRRDRRGTGASDGSVTGRGVLCVELAHDARVRDALARVRSQVLDLERHGGLPAGPRWDDRLDGCAGFWVSRTSPPDGEAVAGSLEVVVCQTDDGPVSRLRYRRDLLDETTARRMALHYHTLLESLAGAPEARLSELSMLSRAEHHQIAWEWNPTRRTASGECLHELFTRQAERLPDVPAVVDGARVLTFRELERRSNRWAHHLRHLGVGPEVAVGICFERSAAMIVAILAVLKAGGAYVPVDPAYPAERRRWIFGNARVRVLVDPQADTGRLEALPETCPASGVRPSNLAYVIHTSGSTGSPKGVMVRHRSVVHLVHALSGTVYPAGEKCLRVALNAPLAFDASVKQWIQLLCGHTLCLCPKETRQDPERLLAFLTDQRVEALDATPSQLTACERAGLLQDSAVWPTYLLCGGEAITPALWNRLAALRGSRVSNVYGPTEATVDATATRLTTGRRPHLGRPLPGVDVRLTDAGLRPVPIGVNGEIVIGGAGLARGYVRRPAETATRFVPHPWSDAAGERLYRTGDRASYLPDGTLAFLGRLDHQMKVRGFRIEPGEIEGVLEGYPGVAQAVVVPRRELDGELVAYFVTRSAHAGITAAGLRNSLATKLPEYMVPARFIRLEALPRTVHGKLDRAALPAPPRRRPQARFTPPRGPGETFLAELWADLLGLDRVSRDDHFFELGGHSILAIHVMTEIRERLDLRLPLAAILERPTVASLAPLLEQRRAVAPDGVVLLGQAPATGQAPLFCVHGIGGHLFRLVHLAHLLSKRRPFYGLQGFSEVGDLSHLGSVYEMARRYRDAIRRTQGAGPYHLAGYSLGYWVAFEIARQLEEEGHEVGFLGFLAYSEERQHLPEMVESVGFEAILAGELGVAVAPGELRSLTPRHRLEHVLSRARAARVLPPGFAVTDAERFVEAFRANFAALQSYEPRPSRVKATFFIALDDPPADPDKLWAGLAGGGTETVHVPGDHTTMLQPPHVETLAREMAARLEARTSPPNRGGNDEVSRDRQAVLR